MAFLTYSFLVALASAIVVMTINRSFLFEGWRNAAARKIRYFSEVLDSPFKKHQANLFYRAYAKVVRKLLNGFLCYYCLTHWVVFGWMYYLLFANPRGWLYVMLGFTGSLLLTYFVWVALSIVMFHIIDWFRGLKGAKNGNDRMIEEVAKLVKLQGTKTNELRDRLQASLDGPNASDRANRLMQILQL